VVVAASRETQLARLQSKRHLDCELAERVVASQLPTEEKINRGDILVWNDGNEEALDEQIRHLVNRCLPIFD
jgi:dephospho-CoA kinase